MKRPDPEDFTEDYCRDDDKYAAAVKEWVQAASLEELIRVYFAEHLGCGCCAKGAWEERAEIHDEVKRRLDKPTNL